MTNHAVFSVATSNNATPVFTLTTGDTLYISRSGSVANTGTGIAILVNDGGKPITILGEVYAAQGIAIDVEITASANIAIGDTGTVHGEIEIGGAFSTLRNQGSIIAQGLAVDSNGSSQTITNYGVIEGTTGIASDGDIAEVINYGIIRGGRLGFTTGGGAVVVSGNASRVTNHGTIENAFGVALAIGGIAGETASALNSGVLRGASNAVGGSNSDDTFVNVGTVFGSVVMVPAATSSTTGVAGSTAPSISVPTMTA